MHTANHERGKEDERALSSSLSAITVNLLRVETQRMTQGIFWVGVLALAVLGSSNMVFMAPSERKLFGAFSYSATGDGNGLVLLLPVFIGMVVAGSLAADRRRRYPTLVLTRGISRVRYLLVKGAAMAAVASFGTFAACALMFVVSALFLPWESMTPPRHVDMASMGPYPDTLESHPFANDLALAALLAFGAGALALSGLMFGAAVANEYVAAAVPFVLLISGIFVFRGELLFLGPYTQLDLMSSYPYSLPRWAWSFTAPVYWSLFAATCVGTAAAIFLKKEEI